MTDDRADRADRAGRDRPLAGRRLLVVGASSGIGRASAIACADAGARVAVAARRNDRLQVVAEECGPDAVALAGDVTDHGVAELMVAGAADALEGLDTVVYAAGTSPLVKLVDADGAAWSRVLATNVVGAALVVRAAMSHFDRAPRPGHVLLLSSSSVGRPWPGLVPYAASKAALEELARGLRSEHPHVTFTRVSVGPTVTGFADAWDPDLTAEMFGAWLAGGFMHGSGTMTPAEMAEQLVAVLAAPVRVDDIALMPRHVATP